MNEVTKELNDVLDDVNKEEFRLFLVSCLHGRVSSKNIIDCIISLLKIVDTAQIKGEDKKVLVINVLKNIVENCVTNDEQEKQLLLMFIERVLPSLIDVIISLDKSEIVIRAEDNVKKCFANIFTKCKK